MTYSTGVMSLGVHEGGGLSITAQFYSEVGPYIALRSGGPLAASCCWLDAIFFVAVFNPSFLCLL